MERSEGHRGAVGPVVDDQTAFLALPDGVGCFKQSAGLRGWGPAVLNRSATSTGRVQPSTGMWSEAAAEIIAAVAAT